MGRNTTIKNKGAVGGGGKKPKKGTTDAAWRSAAFPLFLAALVGALSRLAALCPRVSSTPPDPPRCTTPITAVVKPVELVQLAQSPQLYIGRNILSAKECAALRKEAKDEPIGKRFDSHMAGGGGGGDWRRSVTAWLRKDDVGASCHVKTLVARLAAALNVSQTDLQRGHPLQVVQYKAGGRYFPHWDSRLVEALNPLPEWVDYEDFGVHGGYPHTARKITALCYLTAPSSGGQTVFPLALKDGSSVPPEHQPDYKHLMGMSTENPNALSMWEKRMPSYCAGKTELGLSVEPEQGSCVIFWNHLNTSDGTLGQLDRLSFHAGCDVAKGSKWIANVWIEVPNDFNGQRVYRDERGEL